MEVTFTIEALASINSGVSARTNKAATLASLSDDAGGMKRVNFELSAEQRREEAQRALYLAHRAVSELAGQVQGQQGKVEAARTRLQRIEAEIAQLGEALAADTAHLPRERHR